MAGFYFTTYALAVTPLLQQANVPMVVMNAGLGNRDDKRLCGANVIHHRADRHADGLCCQKRGYRQGHHAGER